MKLLAKSTFIFFIVLMLVLFAALFVQGWDRLDPTFLTQFASRKPSEAGIKGALFGSLYVMVLVILLSLPTGIASAALCTEFLPTRSKVRGALEILLASLAGVPSIVFGILGLAVFVRCFDLGRSILAGSLTLSLLVMPWIFVVSREAFLRVAPELRFAAAAMGANKWQVFVGHTLPRAVPMILSGSLFAIGRAAGEAAPLILIGAMTFVSFVPTTPFDIFTVLPLQIFSWAMRPQAGFSEIAASGILVLLMFLGVLYGAAFWIRGRYENK